MLPHVDRTPSIIRKGNDVLSSIFHVSSVEEFAEATVEEFAEDNDFYLGRAVNMWVGREVRKWMRPLNGLKASG